MTSEWDGMSGALEYELGPLAGAVTEQISRMESEVDDWKNLREGRWMSKSNPLISHDQLS